MPLPESKQPDDTAPKIEPATETNLSARAGAESAVNEFQTKMIHKLTDQQAKDAYARLMVGRGFDRPRPAPVMTIHSAIVSGESKVAEAKVEPPAAESIPDKKAEPEPDVPPPEPRRDFLHSLAHFFRKRE